MDVLCNNPEPHGEHKHDIVMSLACDGRLPCGGRGHDSHLILRAVEVFCSGRLSPDPSLGLKTARIFEREAERYRQARDGYIKGAGGRVTITREDDGSFSTINDGVVASGGDKFSRDGVEWTCSRTETGCSVGYALFCAAERKCKWG